MKTISDRLLQSAACSRRFLEGDSLNKIFRFILSRQNSDGGFRGRGAERQEGSVPYSSNYDNTGLTPQLRNRLDELMVVEKASQLLEHYKNEAIRALNPLKNALLKSLLRRVTTKMLSGV